MGECSVEFCNNSSAKRYVIKIFPTNSRKKIVPMDKNWTRGKHACFCEVSRFYLTKLIKSILYFN